MSTLLPAFAPMRRLTDFAEVATWIEEHSELFVEQGANAYHADHVLEDLRFHNVVFRHAEFVDRKPFGPSSWRARMLFELPLQDGAVGAFFHNTGITPIVRHHDAPYRVYRGDRCLYQYHYTVHLSEQDWPQMAVLRKLVHE